MAIIVTLNSKQLTMLEFSKPLTDLEGNVVKDERGKDVLLSKVLASELAMSAKGDPLKYWDWAKKLSDGKPLELDPSDTSTLKEFIKTNERLTIMPKAQMLELFKD